MTLHAVKDPLGRAYNRTSFLPERREMMPRYGEVLRVSRGPAFFPA